MKEFLAKVTAASILAVGLALFPNLATPMVSASGCEINQYTEWVHSGRTNFYDSYIGKNLTELFTVETINDGGSCGDKMYRSSVDCGVDSGCTSDPSMYDYVNIRVWVCGSYKGLWHYARYGGYTYIWSPWFHYGTFCTRQADNSGTSMSSNNATPNYIQTFVNQG